MAGKTSTPVAERGEVTQAGDQRRRFLRRGAALGGMAITGGALSAGAQAQAQKNAADELAVPAWSKQPGDDVLSKPYGLPSPFEKDVLRRSRGSAFPGAASSMTPLQDSFGIITPSGLHFERHHSGIPRIDPAQHRLAVHGLVSRPTIFTMDDLVRLPSATRIHFLECSGNTGSEWKAPTSKSVQLSHGLLSCSEWTGVPLAVVLDEVGLSKDAKWLLAEGADGAGMSRSIPIEKALDDALLVYAQNGERLRPEQGYPLRLFLPGYEGNTSIKWLRRIKIGTEPFQSREETSKYTDSLPDGTARQFSFIMEAKSVITYPAPDHTLRGAGFYEIRGLAWTGVGRIRRVDVSVDGGRNWLEARLEEPVLDRALTRFRLPWKWDGSPVILQSRAIDNTGYVQPTRQELITARGLNSNYHFNAIQSWSVNPNGIITNVHA
jgi:sulfane dehydrogenase subunit SoxC